MYRAATNVNDARKALKTQACPGIGLIKARISRSAQQKIKAISTYGTKWASTYEIIESSLDQKDVRYTYDDR